MLEREDIYSKDVLFPFLDAILDDFYGLDLHADDTFICTKYVDIVNYI